MAQLVGTIAGLAIASVGTVNGLAVASVGTVAGLDNTAAGGSAPVQVYINSTRGTNASAGTALTLTIGADLVNGYIVVDWALYSSSGYVVTACSFNGNAMTSLVSYALVGDTNNRIQMYGLAVGSLAAGTYNVTFTVTGGFAIGEYAVGARAYNNVHQTVSTGTAATASSSTPQTSSSITVTSATGELIVDTLLQGNGLLAVATGTGHTERWDQGFAITTQTSGAGGDAPGSASLAVSWTFTIQEWAAAGLPLKPA